MTRSNQEKTYPDLEAYCAAHPHLKAWYIAGLLDIDPSRFSKLRSRKYGLRPTEAEEIAIANLLNQKPAYVRSLYEAAA
jgi:hypothetical protein